MEVSSVGADTHLMRVARLYGIRDLRIEHLPRPAPAHGEVLLKVASVGVCGSDVHYYVEGCIGDQIVAEPMIPGHEFSAWVAEPAPRRRWAGRGAVGGCRAGRFVRPVRIVPARPSEPVPQCSIPRVTRRGWRQRGIHHYAGRELLSPARWVHTRSGRFAGNAGHRHSQRRPGASATGPHSRRAWSRPHWAFDGGCRQGRRRVTDIHDGATGPSARVCTGLLPQTRCSIRTNVT